MTNLLKKLNYNDHPIIHILNSPISFFGELEAMKRFADIRTQFCHLEKADFALFFVRRKEEVEMIAKKVLEVLSTDAVLWMAFPKMSPTEIGSEVTRDEGWNSLLEQSFRGIQSIAINRNWSALKFSKFELSKA